MDWCHNLVLVYKPDGSLHVCLDPRTINNALRFNVHNSRTFQDIMSSIRCVAKVSKIDANSGFWTLPMDPDSQLLTTFNTPWGQYCFVKMPFGLNQAQYFFQFYMDQNFRDINSTTNLITDDVMVHGETEKEHDQNLLQVLNKCREIGLKLNPEKCIFGKPEVKFYGNIMGKAGLKADPKKVEAIVNLPVPTNKTEMSSFLGMCNYLTSFVPRLSDITEPLRQLIKKSVVFTWNESYDRAFRRAKLCVANALTLRYFDPDKTITIECDASGSGISRVLLQDEQPILFISQALTDTQKHYSNIEWEVLVVVVVEHLHHYIFGRKFRVRYRSFAISQHFPEMSKWYVSMSPASSSQANTIPDECCLCNSQVCAHGGLSFTPCGCQNRQGRSHFESSNSRCGIEWKVLLRRCHHGQIGKNYTVGLAWIQ